jgi:hypothetical protein
MPILTLRFDQGRPVVDLYVATSAAETARLRQEGFEVPAPQTITALVDTGASKTKVATAVLVGALRMQPVGKVDEHTASTGKVPVERNVYAVYLGVIGFANGVLAYDLPVSEAQDLSGLGVQALLGRDVLDHCLLVYQGPERGATLAFEPPTPP